ncbi:STM3941 family protein [Mucilaginibacter terrae]|uniref:STM3941 family protein n=1 Tax=Mucilaginibacter terrae TaxID=1955052 RepID=UPI0036447468
MNIDDAPIEIQNSRTKLAGLFVISLLFVSVGLWMALKPQGSLFGSLTMVRVVGVAAIVFFGLACAFMLKQLGNKKPVIIISAHGITDRSSATSVGFIPWEDITDIRETMVINQSFMTIDVKNPEHYISQQTNAVKRKLMQLNFDKYNSLISISANSLQCKHFQLRHLLQSEFKSYQARKSQAR